MLEIAGARVSLNSSVECRRLYIIGILVCTCTTESKNISDQRMSYKIQTCIITCRILLSKCFSMELVL